MTKRLTPERVEAANREFRHAHPREVVRWAVESFARERRVVMTALQAEGVVIADLAIAADPDVRVVTIDTGRLPEETLAYLDTLRVRWDRDIEVVMPDPADVEPFVRREGANAFYKSPGLRLRCCDVRKVRPLNRVLAQVDCWLSGLRREDTPERATAGTVELDAEHGGIVKVNPLVDWTSAQVFAYLKEHRLPEHPLYRAGYASIGCAPCTRAVRPGEDARAGRWWWERDVAKECGIHGRPLIPVPVGTA